MNGVYCACAEIFFCKRYPCVNGVYCACAEIFFCKSYACVNGVYCACAEIFFCKSYPCVNGVYCACTEIFFCKSYPCVNGVCNEDDILGYSCDCCPAFQDRNCDTATGFRTVAVRGCDHIRTKDCYYTIGQVRCQRDSVLNECSCLRYLLPSPRVDAS